MIRRVILSLVFLLFLFSTALFAFDDSTYSWWCGDEDIGGYNNRWLQFLTTEEIDLPSSPSGNLIFTFKSNYRVQTATGSIPDGFDSWDGLNVRVATGGDTLFEVMEPIGGYPYESMYAFDYNLEGTDMPGWGGNSYGWISPVFNLNAYLGETIQLRFALASDGVTSSYDNPTLMGWVIDDLLIRDDEDTIFYHGGGDVSQMTASNGKRAWGDHWEFTEVRYRSPTHCWLCEGGYPNLSNSLISPNIEVPSTDDTIVFLEYWVYCDFQDIDGDEDGYLDDYMMLFISPDNGYTYYWLNGVCRSGMYDSDTFVVVDRNHGGNVVRSGSMYGTAEIADSIRETGQVKLYFVVYTDQIDEVGPGEGIYLDDIMLTKVPAIHRDIMIYMIGATPTNLDEEIQFTVLLFNNGLDIIPGVPIRYQITRHTTLGDSVVYTGMHSPFPTISSAETLKVTTNWTPTIPGDYSFLSYVAVTGDEDNSNDSLFYDFRVYGTDTVELGYDDGEFNPFDDDGHTAYLLGPDLMGFDYAAVQCTAPFDNPVVTHISWWAQRDYPVRVSVLSSIDDTPGDLIAEDSCLDVTPFTWVSADIEDVVLTERDFFITITTLRDSTAFGLYADTSSPVDGRSWLYSAPDLYNMEDLDFLLRAVVTSSARRYALSPLREDYSVERESRRPRFREASFHPMLEMDTIYYEGFEHGVIGWNRVDYTYSPSIPVYWHPDTFMHYTSIRDALTKPYTFSLKGNYPNPFNANTQIAYSIADDSFVRLEIFDLLGKRVALLVNEIQSPGEYEVMWEGKNFERRKVSAGVYLYRFSAGDYMKTSKMLLLK
ncbi:T9SS type A sorting domain-containing protein [bacterium]|nr:T9SS type A sorting domain-containing protein [bacterium]